jgi:hypothetical protein
MVEWDIGAVINAFAAETCELLQKTTDREIAAAVREHIGGARRAFFDDECSYKACLRLLEAHARHRDLVGPDRLEVVGKAFCDCIRRVYPSAPRGFEKIGRTGGRR